MNHDDVEHVQVMLARLMRRLGQAKEHLDLRYLDSPHSDDKACAYEQVDLAINDLWSLVETVPSLWSQDFLDNAARAKIRAMLSGGPRWKKDIIKASLGFADRLPKLVAGMIDVEQVVGEDVWALKPEQNRHTLIEIRNSIVAENHKLSLSEAHDQAELAYWKIHRRGIKRLKAEIL